MSEKKPLTAEQKRFVKKLTIHEEKTIAQWLSFFSGLSHYDAKGDIWRKRLKVMSWTGFFLIFIPVLLVDMIGQQEAEILSGVFVVFFVLSLLFNFIMRAKDIPDQLRGFVYPMLQLLKEDIKEGSLVHLELDLKGPVAKKKVSERTVSSRYPKIKESCYQDLWFSGHFMLADHSSVRFKILDAIRERKVTKKNRRGKIKTKYKYKIKRTMDFAIGLKKSQYALRRDRTPDNTKMPSNTAETEKEVMNERSIKEQEKRWVVKIRKTEVFRGRFAIEPLDSFLSVMAFVYKNIQPLGKKGID